MTTTKTPLYDCKASELGRADRVYEVRGMVFKLAQHLKTGEWAIWIVMTETHDEERFWAECGSMPIDEAMAVRDEYKLAEPVNMALKVDDDMTPEYARSNEGIFEIRCHDVLSG